MTDKEAISYFIDSNEHIISAAKDENRYNYEAQQIEDIFMRRDFEAKELAIKALEQTRWIPVSERLPEEDEWVLITYYYDYEIRIEIALLDEDGWYYSSIDYKYWIAEHPPIAWMPLPQPYKAEMEGEE